MRYGSVCSGIEAASVAWSPMGWTPVFFSEIAPFPSAVLAHHYGSNMPGVPASGNGIPNHGDMTKFQEWPDHAIDLLVGGTPCQSFSVAGLRAGLADPRGNLMLTYLAIAARYQPRWLVWENVPGVLSSNDGRDFGSFLGALGQLGYGFAYRVLDAQFCRASGYAGAVPQRRRRVFVVGYLGDWRRAAAVLFDAASLRGDSAPSRSARKDVAPTISARPTGGGGLGTDFDLDGGLIAAFGGNDTRGPIEVSTAMNAHGGPAVRLDFESETFVAHPVAFDTTQITSKTNRSQPEPGDPCHPLAAGAHPPAIAFDARQSDVVQYGPATGPLDTDGYTMAVAYALRSDANRSGVAKTPSKDANGVERLRDAGFSIYEELAPTLDTGAAHSVATNWAVRRLTPKECERLQGFKDGYTLVPHRGKPAADGPRYKALGNSMAVNVMSVIGARIQMVEDMTA